MTLNQMQREILAQIREKESWMIPEEPSLTDEEIDRLQDLLDDDTDPDLVSEVMGMLLAGSGEMEDIW